MREKIIREILVSLIGLLFTYTSFNKILDYNIFIFQISLSPLSIVKNLASYIAPIVILTELVIVVALCIEKYRLTGLYLSLFLLVLFECYIMAMLLFGLSLPCACGGVIAKMSWKEHIFFNAFFIIVTFLSINFNKKDKSKNLQISL